MPLGYSLDDIRKMIPRDWLLIRAAHEAAAKAGQPGADAPSRAELDDLIRDYG